MALVLGVWSVRSPVVRLLRSPVWRRFPRPCCRAGYNANSSQTRALVETGGVQSLSPELSGSLGDESEPRQAPTGALLSSFNIDILVALLRQENGRDICVVRLPPEMKYTDYFVIVSASSTRHLQAMTQYVLKMYKYMKKTEEPQIQLEGREAEDWQCLDFGNIVVHFMLPETRELYELEKLWTLRSYDDQLTQLETKPLPLDFIYGVATPEL
ncbi:mitochondrial assembly of ribosomal large subunit protein 1 [Microcaecilia unicolor]|uniref:Mitochondrial assembly of ribosomal large subunit protein 1 n=1 Tax=Microcaecilia unicolor TaxID=1415580 RepID=A0A6P7X5I6_9AMPH|nr:mitochondrial assembly of ribosomal large subunit protein 1 [Microcaecilia unicolor]